MELLVALAISSILILAVQTAFSLGIRLWRRVEDRRSYEEQARQVIVLLRTELTGLYLPPDSQEEGAVRAIRRQQFGSAGEQVFSFFTTTPGWNRGLPPGACARATYEYRKKQGEGEPEGTLIHREQLAAGEKIIGESSAGVIASGLSSFSLTYTENDGGGKGESGDASTKPPKLVKLSMSWQAKNAVTSLPEPVSFSTQFWVPVKSPLMPEDKEK